MTRRFRAAPLLAAAALGLASTAAVADDDVLRDPALLLQPGGERLMPYLVSCALPVGATVHVPGAPHRRWTGAMGLAPEWRTRALTAAEQRLLSACLLARSNAYGVSVALSLRTVGASDHPALRTTAEERRRFDRFEGVFFGNLFADPPVAYACRSEGGADRALHLARARRVCTVAGAQPGFTVCGFVDLGRCTSGSFVQGGVDYSAQAIAVWLPS